MCAVRLFDREGDGIWGHAPGKAIVALPERRVAVTKPYVAGVDRGPARHGLAGGGRGGR